MRKQPLVVLDPGHGGWETGVQTDVINEKDVNLAVCLELRDLLEEAGVNVSLTREADLELTACKRADIVQELGADLFVSWHCDELEDESVAGVSLWVDEQCADLMHRMMEFERIGEHLCYRSGQDLLGVFQEHDKVLSRVSCPAVVIKSAFLTSPIERHLCSEPKFRQLQAKGAAEGIMRLLKEWKNGR